MTCFNVILALTPPRFWNANKKLRAISFPFSKEIHVLAANEDVLVVDMVDYYDIRESGKIGQSVKTILGYGCNEKKIKNVRDHLCDLDDPDIILVGGQSATLHHNVFNEQYFAFSQYEFLIGTNPDAVFLMINSYDDIYYIRRCVTFIESATDTSVLACILSPVKHKGVKTNVIESLSSDMMEYIGKPISRYNQFDEMYSLMISFFGGKK